MEFDLLFTAFKETDWRKISQQGSLEPESDKEDQVVLTFTGEHAEKILNDKFGNERKVLLIVLDPLRIQHPIKQIKQDDNNYVAIHGKVSLDAVIDKILLRKSREGSFSLNVRHFD